jgi:hypothetical protein
LLRVTTNFASGPNSFINFIFQKEMNETEKKERIESLIRELVREIKSVYPGTGNGKIQIGLGETRRIYTGARIVIPIRHHGTTITLNCQILVTNQFNDEGCAISMFIKGYSHHFMISPQYSNPSYWHIQTIHEEKEYVKEKCIDRLLRLAAMETPFNKHENAIDKPVTSDYDKVFFETLPEMMLLVAGQMEQTREKCIHMMRQNQVYRPIYKEKKKIPVNPIEKKQCSLMKR